MFRATAMTGDGPAPTVVGYGDVHDAYLESRDGRTLFNTGSVGNPLDEPTPSYVILEGVLDATEPAPFEVRFVRVPYDVDAEIAVAAPGRDARSATSGRSSSAPPSTADGRTHDRRHAGALGGRRAALAPHHRGDRDRAGRLHELVRGRADRARRRRCDACAGGERAAGAVPHDGRRRRSCSPGGTGCRSRSPGRRPAPPLLAATGVVEGGWPAAVGAFLVVAALILLTALWPQLGRLIARIPPSIAQAMLAGVLLPLCLAPITGLVVNPWGVVPGRADVARLRAARAAVGGAARVRRGGDRRRGVARRRHGRADRPGAPRAAPRVHDAHAHARRRRRASRCRSSSSRWRRRTCRASRSCAASATRCRGGRRCSSPASAPRSARPPAGTPSTSRRSARRSPRRPRPIPTRSDDGSPACRPVPPVSCSGGLSAAFVALVLLAPDAVIPAVAGLALFGAFGVGRAAGDRRPGRAAAGRGDVPRRRVGRRDRGRQRGVLGARRRTRGARGAARGTPLALTSVWFSLAARPVGG